MPKLGGETTVSAPNPLDDGRGSGGRDGAFARSKGGGCDGDFERLNGGGCDGDFERSPGGDFERSNVVSAGEPARSATDAGNEPEPGFVGIGLPIRPEPLERVKVGGSGGAFESLFRRVGPGAAGANGGASR